ncbi:MAG: hypothetical protein M1818_000286 [Claussenomyces sp. TS43310]|nr:MAG: hypothetical protein M1818_000286 [Claussenomyces sp. TS43310]
MSPTNALNRATVPATESLNTSYPGLTSGAANTGHKSQYEEIQGDELIALSSIYGEDFQTLEAKTGAWKKAEPMFRIAVKSSNEVMRVTLQVTFVATYPKSLPLIALKDADDLRESTQYKLRKTIETRSKDLAAEEQPMIMEIVDAVRDILEEAAIAKAVGMELPSLEEERAIHEAELARLTKEQEQEEERKKEVESQEEDRMLRNMVQDELKRQRAKVREAKKKSKPPALANELTFDDENQESREKILFDQPITLLDQDGNPRLFQAVNKDTRIRCGPISDCYTVKPILKGSPCQVLALKQTILSNLGKDGAQIKSMLRTLEADIEKSKKARHPNILELFDYKIEKSSENDGESDVLWTFSVLYEYAEKGSLVEFLEIAGSLGVERVRSWTVELLDALRFLHEHGIIHQDLHASNILLIRLSAGTVTAKIADAGFQRQLHELKNVPAGSTQTLAKSTYWLPPENANANKAHYTQKTDIWDFGIIFLQMIFGLKVFQKYASPDRLMEAVGLSEALNEILRKFFRSDPKKRPRAFELSTSEFLATDAPILPESSSAGGSQLSSMTSLVPPTLNRQRHDSSHTPGAFSRWKDDFTDVSRLGKGGFGEVVKARQKLDGQFYAIKTIVQNSSASLAEILKEVRLLSQLNHPYVVRYYNTWREEVYDTSETDDDSTSVFEESSNAPSPENADPDIEFRTSTRGLDFISSSGFPQVEFGYGSDDESSKESDENGENEEDDTTSSQRNDDGADGDYFELRKTPSPSKARRPSRTILYIQMEYCERRTLRDLIKRGLYKDSDEIWRLFRQMLEGLAHIHSLNIVHRDLKPENIFIDGALNVRIGDFGLATAGQYSAADRATNTAQSSHNMTTSIGTASYVAPEVRSSVGTYNSKVDMYSLGIIFFEMCFPAATTMERVHVLHDLRQVKPTLPQDFNTIEKAIQAEIILSLVNHNPKERPSSAGLLQSGKIPVQMESETIRQALAGLLEPKSQYYQKMMAALFSRPITQVKDFAWDMDGRIPAAKDIMIRNVVKQQLTSIFRRHGALEIARPSLFPRSSHYGPNVVQLLDQSGALVQLPYDLTLPLARSVAKHTPTCPRSFTFGSVFRDRPGGQPVSFGEVDFDIVSDSLDLPLKEAEVIKVLDEITTTFPSLAATRMCFHLNHSDLLNLVFEFCKIEPSTRSAVAEILSKLNIQQWTWQKIRNELRSPLIGVSATSLDDLQQFDFRDTPSKAFQRLKTIFEGTNNYEKASPAIAHINEVVGYLGRMEVHAKIYVSPLSSLKEKFYTGSILFSSIYDSKQRDVFAAGGRYDSLIREYRPRLSSQTEDRHAVGFSLAWEKLSTSMSRYQKSNAKSFLKRPDDEAQGSWTTRRCDVLVASFDAAILRTSGIEILQHLWARDVSAELAVDSRSPEDLLSKYRDDQHYWIVIIKQDSVVKVKTMGRKDVQDVDIPISQLDSWLQGESRERDQREGTHERSKLPRNSSLHDPAGTSEHEQEVRVLVAQTKSKKSNRHNIVEQAQGRAATLVQSFLDGPIAAIETTDYVMDLIRETRLSDPDTWRKVSHSVPMAERRYIGEIHDLIKGLAFRNKDVTRNAFIYNFRTGNCIYYDMGL